MLTGIQLNDQTSFITWAESILPWLNAVMTDVSAGIGTELQAMKERQVRYTAYLGTLVELDSKAETYRKAALAEAIDKYAGKYSPSLVAKVAEKDCSNETKVAQAIHRLITTTSDQLIAIASRLKFERELFINSGNGQSKGNRLQDMPFYQS
jgi:hypothetical protein